VGGSEKKCSGFGKIERMGSWQLHEFFDSFDLHLSAARSQYCILYQYLLQESILTSSPHEHVFVLQTKNRFVQMAK
jgi:hypothetical protein